MDELKLISHAGEYYLRGVMEMACGFKLNPDHTFQFMVTYGALDRYASGTWRVEGNAIIFNSKPWRGKDFALLESKSTNQQHITIIITARNTNILRYVFVAVNNSANWMPVDNSGVIYFPKQNISSIALAFEFCPERFSRFTIDDSSANHFTFGFESWIFEIFFRDFQLTLDKEGFTGRHPMLKGEDYHYVRKEQA